MAAPSDESVPWDALSVGATRPAVIRGLNVPFWFVLPIIGLPMVIVAVTRNPIWLLLIIALTALGRWVVSRDHNRPRVLYLALISGALFADRRHWGGDSADPLGEVRHGD
jgi:type IV secretory pathway VirB3-like protein